MSDTETPVGERPATGGRVRQYETDAERARAWRERQRARQPRGEPVPAMLAEASLAAAVERLGSLVASQRAAVGGELDRIEEAVLALGDPDAVADQLQAVRTETARQLAEAADQVRAANQTAKDTSRRAEEAVAEAEAAGNAAFERVEQLEPELEALRHQLADTEGRAALAERQMVEAATATEAERTELVEAMRVEHEAQLAARDSEHQGALTAVRAEMDRLRAEHDAQVAALQRDHRSQLEAIRAETAEVLGAAEHRVGEAEQLRARAEGVASELRSDLDRARVETAEARAEIPRAAEAAGVQVRSALEAQHRAEMEALTGRLEGRIGRLEGELAAATARGEAARELATAYRSQLEEPAVAPARRGSKSRQGAPEET